MEFKHSLPDSEYLQSLYRGEQYLRAILDDSIWNYNFDNRNGNSFIEIDFRSFVRGFFLMHKNKVIAEFYFSSKEILIETGIFQQLRTKLGFSYMDNVTVMKNIFMEYYDIRGIIPTEVQLHYPGIYIPDIKI